MINSSPARIKSLVSPFACLRSSTLILYLAAIEIKLSPLLTVYLSGVGVAVGARVAVAVGGLVGVAAAARVAVGLGAGDTIGEGTAAVVSTTARAETGVDEGVGACTRPATLNPPFDQRKTPRHAPSAQTTSTPRISQTPRGLAADPERVGMRCTIRSMTHGWAGAIGWRRRARRRRMVHDLYH